jgi:hypothetical protein
VHLRKFLKQRNQFLMKVLSGDIGKAEEILPLTNPDNDSNPSRESYDHRIWNEFDDRSQTRQTKDDQDASSHQSRQLQAADTMLSCDAGKNDDERSSRPGDLQATATQAGNDESRNNGRRGPVPV